MTVLADVWRREAPHVLAALLHRYGDLGDCEDAAQDAAAAATAQWPVEGVPADPRAWLIRVASRRLIDRFRADRARRHREEHDAARQAGTHRPQTRPRPAATAVDTATTRCAC